MAHRPTIIVICVLAGVAVAAIVVGKFMAVPPALVATAPSKTEPTPPASAPLTTSSPAVASNGHLTIRLLSGQPER